MAALDTLFASLVNPLNHGSDMNAATINAALTAIGADDSILFIPNTNRNRVENSWTIDADVTVPSNVVLLVPYGSVISVSSGFTWTQNGQVIAGRYQIWQGLGTTTFGATIDVRAEWTGGVNHKMVEIDTNADKATVAATVLQVEAGTPTIFIKDTGQATIDTIQGLIRWLTSTSAVAATIGYVAANGEFLIENDSVSEGIKFDSAAGEYVFLNLPTSAAGLPTGALWNNAGVINVA